MKKIILIVFCSFFLLQLQQAQELIPFKSSIRRPVLNDEVAGKAISNRNDFNGMNSFFATLSPEQKKKIKDIRLKEKKQLIQINNQLSEKKMHLITLQTAEKPDMKAINKTIDELTALIGSKMKIKSNSTQQIREMLTEEQRVEFDMNKQLKSSSPHRK